MFKNKAEIQRLINENIELKNKLKSEESTETIKQHYCSTCIHGVYWYDYEDGSGYLCELEHPCNNYEKKPEDKEGK